MTQGQRSGTILGEAVRFIGQFKTFPVTLMTKSLQQEMNGKALGELGASEVMQLTKFIAGMTAMGAITTVATDFLRNKLLVGISEDYAKSPDSTWVCFNLKKYDDAGWRCCGCQEVQETC